LIGETAHSLSAIVFLVASAVVLVILGLVFFSINLWIIAYSAELLYNANMLNAKPAAEFVVLSAALLSAASMIGSKHGKKE
tara:strand:+ start:2717 stop:2959 length:243 start_codon:yes stop_codon:yes gene_type:complete